MCRKSRTAPWEMAVGLWSNCMVNINLFNVDDILRRFC